MKVLSVITIVMSIPAIVFSQHMEWTWAFGNACFLADKWDFSGDIAVHTGEYCGSCDSVQEEIFLNRRITWNLLISWNENSKILVFPISQFTWLYAMIGYALMIVNPGILNSLSPEPAYILMGTGMETSDLGTVSTEHFRVLWFAIAVLFYYPIGTSWADDWTFKYTLYILSAWYLSNFGSVHSVFPSRRKCSVGNVFSTFTISLSTFPAYAMCYPVLLGVYHSGEDEVDGNFYVVIVVYEMIPVHYGRCTGIGDPYSGFCWISLFFSFGTKDFSRYNPKEAHRRNESQSNGTQGDAEIRQRQWIAKCKRFMDVLRALMILIFGISFCSRCNGNYEYCWNHLLHIHMWNGKIIM